MKNKIIVGALVAGMIPPACALIYHYFGFESAQAFVMSIFFAGCGAVAATYYDSIDDW